MILLNNRIAHKFPLNNNNIITILIILITITNSSILIPTNARSLYLVDDLDANNQKLKKL